MQRLFERIADEYHGTVEAEEVRENYAKLTFTEHLRKGGRTTVELFPHAVVDTTGAPVPLVRVQSEGKAVPVLVSPVPSAIIAVCLR